jgi:DNA ligase-1
LAKFDGVRAYWDSENLISRKGEAIMAPDWFLSILPKIPLDGELW